MLTSCLLSHYLFASMIIHSLIIKVEGLFFFKFTLMISFTIRYPINFQYFPVFSHLYLSSHFIFIFQGIISFPTIITPFHLPHSFLLIFSCLYFQSSSFLFIYHNDHGYPARCSTCRFSSVHQSFL